MTTIARRSVRWLQILLTLFYGHILSNGYYEYFLQGLAGLISRIRPSYDSFLLISLAGVTLVFFIYAISAIWYCRTRMFLTTVLISIVLFALTLIRTILEIYHMGLRPVRTEWLLIRITELVIRIFGIGLSLYFVQQIRHGYKPANF